MDQNIIEKANKIISDHRLDCVLALIDLDGSPTASTITVSKNDGIKWLTFCTVYGNKDKRIEKCDRASVCFTSLPQSITDPLYNITLVGKIEVINNIETKKEMWYDDLKSHFYGYDDPKLCVLKFSTERYNIMIEESNINGIL